MDKIAELLAQKAALEQRIIEAQRAQKAQAIAQVKDLMAEHGLTVADLGSRTGVVRRGTGGKVAAKYRHPQTHQTWSGRGLQPNWLKQALAGGARLEDFKV
jgi:DNA-binding protein H-NS